MVEGSIPSELAFFIFRGFMTEKLFLTDSYLKEFDAKVVSVDGKFVVFDKTAFYPQGGGQQSDKGKIISAAGETFNVMFVKKSSGDVIHELDRLGLKAGETVHGVVDWENRFHSMRMHSAAHIIHGVIFKELGLLVSGNQLGWPQSRIDINIENFDRQRFDEIEEKCNSIAGHNLEVSFYFISKEEARQKNELFRLMGVDKEKLLEVLGNEIRILKIGDFDESIDGGTHVKNTSEIGKIRFAKFENKGAANRRIYFELAD